ncbi:SEL1-like repeat protein [unidentified bacterial endosymbiont]|uniref:SEL1-like repeat protein n=1 Tax=unidentified bacterial endosymbiont TaxID=2355 RepID=UPI003450DDD4
MEYYRVIGETLDIPPVQTNHGFLYAYEKGLGVERNIQTAIEWYKKSANGYDKEAQKYLEGIRKYDE